MGATIVRQPNGLLARFSTIVDHFTHFNLSEEEMLLVLAFKSGDELAKKMISDGLAELNHASEKQEEGYRWKDSLETVKIVHGDSGIKEILGYLESGEKVW